jgi:capsular exopolysaccharide synthesis family protein
MHGEIRVAGRDPDASAAGFNEGSSWTLATSVEIVRRRWRIPFAVVGLLVALAMLYIVSTPPLFTATAALIPDTKRTPQSPTEASQNVIIDQGLVESQVETLKSEKIAIAVIDKLGLWSDPEFIDPDANYLSRGLGALKAAISFGEPTPSSMEDANRRRVILRFKGKLDVGRVGRSYLTEISFTSLDPRKAARVANEIAEAYIQDQLGAKFFNAERAGTWMHQRVEELRIQAGEAAQAVAEFKLRRATVGQNPNTTGQLDDVASGRDAVDELRRLETAAQRKKTLYDNLLNRYNRVVQFVEQQSFPVTEARVVTEAMPPTTKSYPKTMLILAVALFAGGMVGIAGALAREFFDRSLRAPEQIEQELGVNCLGFLPTLSRRTTGSRRKRALPLFSDSGTSHNAAETLRAIKVAIDRGHQGAKVVAIVSPRTGDGKTTIACNLATVLAESTPRTLLIDGDLRNRSLTRALAPNLAGGLLVLLEGGEVAVADQVVRNGLGFHLIGAGVGGIPAHPSDLLSSREMRELLNRLRKVCDYILIDLPSVLERIDVSACADLMDAFVLVAHADRTSLDDIGHALRTSNVMAERLVGMVVNQSRRAAGMAYSR